MKRLLVLVSFAALLLLFIGCQESGTNDSVIIEVTSNNDFPEFLVGRWSVLKQDSFRWGIKFERDGSISEVFHIIWDETIIVEKGGYQVEGPNDTYAYFELGDCEADYDAETRNLKVKVILAGYIIKLEAGELTGRSDDYFEGPVSEDGKTWNAKWRGYGYLDGAKEPDKEFVDANPELLVFTKLGPDK